MLRCCGIGEVDIGVGAKEEDEGVPVNAETERGNGGFARVSLDAFAVEASADFSLCGGYACSKASAAFRFIASPVFGAKGGSALGGVGVELSAIPSSDPFLLS